MNRVDRILDNVRGSTILDVGCAGHTPRPDSPRWLHGRLVQRFPRVVGIDIDEMNVERLRASGFQEVHVASAETFDLSQKFDTIVAGEVLEHLSNPGMFLARARGHLAPDGRIVLTTPYPFSLLRFLYALWKFPQTVPNPEHTMWFCPQTLKELCRRLGLRITSWDLLEDYEWDNPSPPYRLFVRMTRLIGTAIPKRWKCNTMIFVIQKDGRSSD